MFTISFINSCAIFNDMVLNRSEVLIKRSSTKGKLVHTYILAHDCIPYENESRIVETVRNIFND